MIGNEASRRSSRRKVAVLCVAVAVETCMGCRGPVEDPRFQPRRERARRMEYVLVGFLNYNDWTLRSTDNITPAESRGRIPPATWRDGRGRALYSWRLRLVPFVEGFPTKMDLHAPWYAPANHALTSRPMPYYCFSRDPDWRKRAVTNVVGVAGPGTAFDAHEQPRREILPPDLIVIIETGKAAVHWAEPGDLDIADVDQWITAGLDGQGVLVGFADGQVWFLDRRVALEDVRAFMTIEGAKRLDRATQLGKYRVGLN